MLSLKVGLRLTAQSLLLILHPARLKLLTHHKHVLLERALVLYYLGVEHDTCKGNILVVSPHSFALHVGSIRPLQLAVFFHLLFGTATTRLSSVAIESLTHLLRIELRVIWEEVRVLSLLGCGVEEHIIVVIREFVD